MRYPKFLKPGGQIGLIAPSFGCTTQPYRTLFDEAQKQWHEAGYGIVLGPNCYADKGIGKSNTPEACAAEVNDFFLGDKSDVIISCGGGETMCEDLPYIDFDAISLAEPKWFMGYSDNTNLTFTLPVLCDTAAVYGPCAASFGMRERHSCIDDAFGILTGSTLSVHNYDKWELAEAETPEGTEPDPLAPYNLTEDFKLRSFIGFDEVRGGARAIEFSGRLIGGCLDCLSNLVGTPYDRVEQFVARYAADGILWYLEACDLNVMSIRRALWQLDQAGWFEHASGFILGRPRLYTDTWGDFDHVAAAVSILGRHGVPIILDLDIGHLPPAMPIISGAVGHAVTEGNTFTMKYELR